MGSVNLCHTEFVEESLQNYQVEGLVIYDQYLAALTRLKRERIFFEF